MNKANAFTVAVIIILCLPIFGIGLLILYFTGTMFFAPLMVMVYITIGTLLAMKLLAIQKYRKVLVRSVIIGLLLSILFAIPGIYHKTRPVVQPTNVNLFEYSPFNENTKAVQLEEEATYRISSQLPVIDGATALYPIYAAFAQAVYPEKEYDPYYSDVMSNRTGSAYDSLINGEVDIIFVLAPSDEQVELAKSMGRELKLTPIGKEAFVFFINDKNPVDSLTTDEIKGIYSGQITNWKDVGGKNKSIRAFQRDENSGSQTALQHFMGDTPIMDPPVEDIATLMGTMLDVVTDYKNYQNAIRSEEHTSELQSRGHLVCRLLLE